MNPIDLKTLANGRFRLAFDEAALIEPSGKKDPWYQVIPSRYGHIYPYSDTLLAIHSKGSGIRRKLQAIEGLAAHNWSDDGEAIFLFAPGLFNRVAEIAKPRRKRQLSDDQRQIATDRLRAFHFKPNSMQPKAQKQAKNRPIVVQAVLGAK